MTWNRLRTGALLKAKFADIIWFVLSLFHIVVGYLVFVSWRSFRETHEGRTKALKTALRDDLTARRRLFHRLCGCVGLLVVAPEPAGIGTTHDRPSHRPVGVKRKDSSRVFSD